MDAFQDKIAALKKAKNAIVLAHNYQRPEVQAVADHVGDSLVLARKVSSTDARVIVFCGVDFMAEAAKIVNPDRIVLHPVPQSRCPMAGMATPEAVRKMRAKHPDAVVVSYINTSGAVKAESDITCTSGNAVEVVASLPQKKIIFVPDRNLGLWVQRKLPDKEIILWPGHCHVHQDDLTLERIAKAKRENPGSKVLAHPECAPEVLDMADHVASTEGMIKYLQTAPAGTYIVGTEEGMSVRLRKEFPASKFITIHEAVCPNMKKITLEDVARSLETLSPQIEVDPEMARKAKIALKRMLDVQPAPAKAAPDAKPVESRSSKK